MNDATHRSDASAGSDTDEHDLGLTPVWAQDPAVAAALSRCLGRRASSQELCQCIDGLEAKYGELAYVEALYRLAHLHFSPAEAGQHWNQITQRQRSMEERLQEPVDFRVALVGYFLDVNRQLENPTVVELNVFEKTRASAYRDDLTRLHNYRYFREELAREFQRYKRYGAPLSLMMMDIDDFKTYNDLNGHQAGNEALITLAQLTIECFRDVDTVTRYGGEEFAVLMPSTGKNGALTAAERTCERILHHKFPYGSTQPGGRLGASIGVATLPADAKDPAQLVRKADEAMYAAKRQGKGRVLLSGADRRSYRRIEATLRGSCCVMEARYLPVRTVNACEGGLLLRVEQKCQVGSLIDIKLNVSEAGADVACIGRVVRVEEEDESRYVAAIRVVSIPPGDRSLLTEFLTTGRFNVDCGR